MTETRPTPRTRPDTTGLPDSLSIEETWTLLESVPEDPVAPETTDAAWARLSDRLFAEVEVTPEVVGSSKDRVLRPARWFGGLGAAAAAAALTFSLAPVERTAAPGSAAEFQLPGGSTVELNAGSTLRWTRGFGWLPGVSAGDRLVQLEGEAFFSVTRNGSEFRVETSDAVVRVLGTRFNVRAHASSPTRVTVEEGRVAVSARAAEASTIELTAGERGGFFGVRGTLAEQPAPDLTDLVWRRGGISLENASLAEIAAEVERRFATRVTLAGDGLEGERLTLFYDADADATTVLKDVADALGLRLTDRGDGWELSTE
jgi:ferric-dicitrate binding protein FerR (iron transport regulator)